MRLPCVFIYIFQALDTQLSILADLWWLSEYMFLAQSKFKLTERIYCLRLNSFTSICHQPAAHSQQLPACVSSIISGTEKANRDHLCKKEKATKPSWINRICSSGSRQQTCENHCHRRYGCKCLLEGLGKNLNEKIHWKLLNGQKWYPVQEMPWATHSEMQRTVKGLHVLAQPVLFLRHPVMLCWKELLGSTDPQSDPVLTFLHPTLRTSFALVGEFHPVSTANHQGWCHLRKNVLLAHILTGNTFESKSASPCWFLAAIRRMSEPLLELPKILFTELKLSFNSPFHIYI